MIVSACISYCSLLLSGAITKNCTSYKTGATPHTELPVRASIGNNFTARWIGRGGQNELRESPVLFKMIYVCGVGPNRLYALLKQEDTTELASENKKVR
jgi:hypothetical protein